MEKQIFNRRFDIYLKKYKPKTQKPLNKKTDLKILKGFQ